MEFYYSRVKSQPQELTYSSQRSKLLVLKSASESRSVEKVKSLRMSEKGHPPMDIRGCAETKKTHDM